MNWTNAWWKYALLPFFLFVCGIFLLKEGQHKPKDTRKIKWHPATGQEDCGKSEAITEGQPAAACSNSEAILNLCLCISQNSENWNFVCGECSIKWMGSVKVGAGSDYEDRQESREKTKNDSRKKEIGGNRDKTKQNTTVGSALKRKELSLVLILCSGQARIKGFEPGKRYSSMASDVHRQIRQAAVLLKSAVLFSKKLLHFHVLTDSLDLYTSVVNTTAGWPDRYRTKLRFSRHKVWYPEGREDMREMFRVCATARLFIPDLFPALDRVIFLDTDLIFMRPLEDLWAHFDYFDSKQVAAMAPELFHYENSKRNKVPYYGETGLNAGLIHMDLERMRGMEGGWTQTNIDIFDKYRDLIKLADQVS